MRARGIEPGEKARQAYEMAIGTYQGPAMANAKWQMNANGVRSRVPQLAIAQNLNTYTFDGQNNTYVRAMGRRTYESSLSGIEAPEAVQASGAGTGGDWSSWANILESFLRPITQGVGRAIGGKEGPSVVVQQTPAEEKVPGWVVPAAVVGGAGVLFLLLKK